MSKYQLIRHQAIDLLTNTKEGDYITEPDQLASYFEDVSFEEFLQKVYNKRIANYLQRNKARLKANLRQRWFMSNKGKVQETLYRLLANSDELLRLQGETKPIQSSGSDPLINAINPLKVWDDTE